MPNTNTIPAPNSSPMMSSKEIAELTGKEHKTVLRDIRTMLIRLYGMEHVDRDIPEKYRNRHSEYIRQNGDAILNAISGKFGDGTNWNHDKIQGVKWTRDARGYIDLFHLDHSHTVTLVTGYDVEKRKKVVDRWLELEAAPKVAAPALPKTYAEALLEAGRLAQQLEVSQEREKLQQAELDATKPKAQALDRISTSDGSYGLQEAAKILQVGPRAFVQWLRTNRWIYKRPGSTNYLGYQDRINAGYLWHKVSTYETANGETRSRDDVKILPKGLTRLAREVPGASLDPDLSPVPVPGDAPVPFTQAPA